MPRRRRDPEPVARVFGEAVKARRDELGWTLDRLADEMGRRDSAYIGEIERGFHSPTLTLAKEIADALETPLATLVKEL